MAFKDLYKEKEYCGIDLAKTKPWNKKIRVCSGRDFYSDFSYKSLIEKNRHLPFYEKLRTEHPEFNDRHVGSFIRWLYRGMTFEQAVKKVKSDIQREINYSLDARRRKIKKK